MIILARGKRRVAVLDEVQASAFEGSGFVRVDPDEAAVRQGKAENSVVVNAVQDEPVADPPVEPVPEPAEKPKRRRRKKTDAAEE